MESRSTADERRSRFRSRAYAIAVAPALAIMLGGCFVPPAPGRSEAVSATAEPSPLSQETQYISPPSSDGLSPSLTPAPAMGAIDNPAPPGELVALGEGSPFTVGARGPTEVYDTHAVLPLTIHIDWAAVRAQWDGEGRMMVDPDYEFEVRFTAADGETFYPVVERATDRGSEFFTMERVGEGTDVINVEIVVAAPRARVPGGVWEITRVYAYASAFLAVNQ